MKTKLFTLALVALFGLFCSTDANAQKAAGSTVGGNPQKGKLFIKSYPNPTDDDINIRMVLPKELDAPAEVTIINTSGVVVHSFSCTDCIDESVRTINVKSWPAGMYYVRATYLEESRVTKFIKID